MARQTFKVGQVVYAKRGTKGAPYKAVVVDPNPPRKYASDQPEVLVKFDDTPAEYWNGREYRVRNVRNLINTDEAAYEAYWSNVHKREAEREREKREWEEFAASPSGKRVLDILDTIKARLVFVGAPPSAARNEYRALAAELDKRFGPAELA